MVSIIVLTYRNSHLLPPAIESVLRQDYENLEVLVYDDGTPDFDRSFVEGLLAPAGKNIRRVEIFSQPENVGTVRNYDAAIQASRGEYILPLSCDDRYADDHTVSALVEFFEQTGCRICTGRRQGQRSGRIFPSREEGALLQDPAAALDSCLVSNYISGSALYMRRSFYEQMGGYDTDLRLLEDYPFVLKTLLAGERIWFYDRVTILYGEEGVSSGVKDRRGTPVGRMLEQDYRLLREKYTVPGIDRVTDRRCRRYLQLKSALWGAGGKGKKLAAYLAYPDIALAQLRYRLAGRGGSIYWTLRGR